MTFNLSISGSLDPQKGDRNGAYFPATPDEEKAFEEAAAKVKEAAEILRAAGITASANAYYPCVPEGTTTAKSIPL